MSPQPSATPTITPCEELVEPAAPALASAKFSNTGGQLFIQFDSPFCMMKPTSSTVTSTDPVSNGPKLRL